MAGTLFVVGTPIGNLGDLSDRARDTLVRVHVIAAEDTRRTGRLVRGFGVTGPRLVSFFEGNESERVPSLVRTLADGHDVALVTDAGMPGVSDPGYRLIAACIAAGIDVDVVPGPSAVLTALVISGLPTDRFVFEGFLPRAGSARRDRLDALAVEARTIVLFESPRRVGPTLEHLRATLGDDRRAVVARELTKLHQEVLRGSLAELAAAVTGRELKGEVVLVVEGAPSGLTGSLDQAVAMARQAVAGGLRKREAAKRAASGTGVPTSEIYAALVGETGSSS
jgi:16S rRNA (cytidine1402-2'-O)-methyltransferase